MTYYDPIDLPVVLVAIAVVGVLSLFVRRNGQSRSSWPTWLFVPLAVLVSLPLASQSKPPDPLRPFCAAIICFVVIRWAIALAVRERSKGWIVYLLVLVMVPLILFPALGG